MIAIGVTDELPDILGLKERWGTTVLHYPYCHGYEVRDRPLGVIAGGAMSVHQALLVADWGPTTLFVQDAEAPGPDELARLHARKVSVESTPVVALLGSRGPLEAVRLANGRIVSLAAAFVTPRTRPTGHLAERLGCEMVDGPTGPFVKVDPWGRTSIPGIFAAGDIAAPMHNATLATAGGVVAGIAAHQSLALA